ncbi:MAG TPA: hypothetical protein HA254_04895 [Candidatus Diapherotrites archaeon]|uniref:Uncharacterized protein n=1 Tax=Candidatus Iainarchaeum sp. TaxID=3101447 RepID=A0A7J4J432_9ARCH|nr:hypothetical protein [Candidatus Diapherotrites archaeon]
MRVKEQVIVPDTDENVSGFIPISGLPMQSENGPIWYIRPSDGDYYDEPLGTGIDSIMPFDSNDYGKYGVPWKRPYSKDQDENALESYGCVNEGCNDTSGIDSPQLNAGRDAEKDNSQSATSNQDKVNMDFFGERVGIEKNQGNETKIVSGGVMATTKESVEVDQNKLKISGNMISIAPSIASEKAIRAVGNQEVERISIQTENNPVYAVEGKKYVKIVWIIPVEVSTITKVDAQTAEVVLVEKPWWSLFAMG